ncbi:hypothetical protein [Chondromyces crocatus]|uniref:hypothetical protein n=1 Tax=Chondromyces crocatus TaxID=52 RepID=UPI0012E315AD|nr:hypothetical protein [Chondromyces crocatus]
MSKASRIFRLLTLTAGALALNGCRSKAEPAPAPAPSEIQPNPMLVDQTAPGELAEGTELAFGLAIPRKLHVRFRFPDEVVANGNVPAEQLANYVRQRVRADKVETGPAKTVFTGVTVDKNPTRQLRIEVVSRRHRGTDLTVQDVTKVLPEPGLSDEERWKAKGFKPDGSPLDPTRLE